MVLVPADTPVKTPPLVTVATAGVPEVHGVVACAQYLLQCYRANPNQLSTLEAPFCNRPALFFAVARAMSKLVQLLLEFGANPCTIIQGQFKQTFDTSQIMQGTFTPCQYAKAMKQVQVSIPPYWLSRLNSVISILTMAEQDKK